MRWGLIPVREPSGAISELVAVVTDITTQELAKQMSEAQMQLAVKASGVGMWDWDLITRQIVYTDQMAVYLGLFPDTSASEERFRACLHPDDREPVERTHQRTLAEKTETEFSIEYRTIWPDGSMHWLLSRGRGIHDSHGNPTHLIGAGMDITELKQAEEALRESEARVRRFVASNIIGIALLNLHGNIRHSN